MNAWQQTRQKALVLITGVLLSCSAFAQTVTYFHNDISGTPLLATDAAGNVLWKENNRPYGDKLNAQPASAGNKIGYHGKPFDDNTGLSYMGARYYDPVLGRFTGIDPVGFVEGNLHSFNRYAYASNNPYKFVDPDGRYIEFGIEALSITIGVASLASNIQQGNWLSATADAMGVVADAAGVVLPGVPGVVGLGIRASREAADAATTAAHGGGRISGDVLAAARREFEAVKPRFWRNEASTNPGAWSADDLARMQTGKPPIGSDGFPMELHHRKPLAEGGSNAFDNLSPLTRTDHRLGDNYKLNHPNLP